jgi:hypothetical protein
MLNLILKTGFEYHQLKAGSGWMTLRGTVRRTNSSLACSSFRCLQTLRPGNEGHGLATFSFPTITKLMLVPELVLFGLSHADRDFFGCDRF